MKTVDKVNVKVLLILQYNNLWTLKQGIQKMAYHRRAFLASWAANYCNFKRGRLWRQRAAAGSKETRKFDLKSTNSY